MITPRLNLSDRVALGPGKADLLEAMRDTGSIAAAWRRTGMSYQRAHDLVSTLNEDFERPLIDAAAGGARGGGAALTALGAEVLAAYRALVADALTATSPAWSGCARACRTARGISHHDHQDR